MKKIWIPQFIATLVLIGAFNPGNPYGYYILLRWVCCAVFAYLAFQAYEQKNKNWTWILGVTAAIYNPIVPIHLTRSIWEVVNILTIFIAFASFFILKNIESR